MYHEYKSVNTSLVCILNDLGRHFHRMKRGYEPNTEELETAAIQIFADYQCNETLVFDAHSIYMRDYVLPKNHIY